MAKKIVLWFLCAPGDFLGHFVILFFWIFWGEFSSAGSGYWVRLKPASWPVRTWYRGWKGTTFCHGGILCVEHDREKLIVKHESIHIEQFEVIQIFSFIGFIISLGASWLVRSNIPWIFSICFWALSWPIVNICSSIVARLRGENPYKGSSLEEAAYSIVEAYIKGLK